MFGVSPTCENQLNAYANYTHLDFLDSLGSPEPKLEDATDNLETLPPSSTPYSTSNVLEDSTTEEVPSMTLTITNVVSMANMRCHLRLKEISKTSVNVEYKALQNHVIMRLRKPYTVATIWSSGKIWCTGANSLAKARQGARRIARRISHVGFPCRFSNYRIVNIMATCRLPFRVRLDALVKEKPRLMSYEPELAPGLNFKAEKDSSTSLKLFSTGRIVIMGSSMANIGTLVEKLVPLAAIHQTDEPLSDSEDELEIVGGVGVSTSRSRSRSARHHRNASKAAAKAKEAKAASRPFAEMVAADIPALADVLLEEEEDAAAAFDAFEEDEDAVGTDNDSEEDAADDDDDDNDHLNTRLIRMPAPLNSSNFASAPKPVVTSWITGVAGGTTDKLNLVGAVGVSLAKRAHITAYSDQPQQSNQPISIATTTSSTSLPIVSHSTIPQQHILIQQQPSGQAFTTAYSTTPQQTPIFSNTSAANMIPIQFGNRVSPYLQSVSVAAPSNNPTAARIVTVNPSGQTNIVRIVNPMQLGQQTHELQTTIMPQQLQHQGQQAQQFFLNRFPMQTNIISPQIPGGYSLINPTTVQFQQIHPNQTNTMVQSNGATTIINPQQFTNFVYR